MSNDCLINPVNSVGGGGGKVNTSEVDEDNKVTHDLR